MHIKFGLLVRSIISELIKISANLTKKNQRMKNFYYIPISKLQGISSTESRPNFNGEIFSEMGLSTVSEEEKLTTIRDRYLKIPDVNHYETGAIKTALDYLDAKRNSEEHSEDMENIENNRINKEKKHYLYEENDLSNGFIQINHISKFIETALKTISLSQLIQIFDWKNFEDFIGYILQNFGYKTATNFRFSLNLKSYDGPKIISRTTKKIQKRFEIDIVGIKENIILFIDAKLWRRNVDITSNLNTASKYQSDRVHAFSRDQFAIEKLKKILIRQCGKKKKITIPKKSKILALKEQSVTYIYPIIVYVGPGRHKISNCGVPLVSLKDFSSFMQNFLSNSPSFVRYKLKQKSIQSTF